MRRETRTTASWPLGQILTTSAILSSFQSGCCGGDKQTHKWENLVSQLVRTCQNRSFSVGETGRSSTFTHNPNSHQHPSSIIHHLATTSNAHLSMQPGLPGSGTEGASGELGPGLFGVAQALTVLVAVDPGSNAFLKWVSGG